MSANPEDTYLKTKKSLDVHMQLNYKQSIEIAEEEAINNTLDYNKYDLTRKKSYRGFSQYLGIGVV